MAESEASAAGLAALVHVAKSDWASCFAIASDSPSEPASAPSSELASARYAKTEIVSSWQTCFAS